MLAHERPRRRNRLATIVGQLVEVRLHGFGFALNHAHPRFLFSFFVLLSSFFSQRQFSSASVSQ
jgi:hypothetical protein